MNPLMRFYNQLTHRYLGASITHIIREQWHNPIWWLAGGLLIGHWWPWDWWLPLLIGLVVGHLWWGAWTLYQRRRQEG